jgi:hypothetical protein
MAENSDFIPSNNIGVDAMGPQTSKVLEELKSFMNKQGCSYKVLERRPISSGLETEVTMRFTVHNKLEQKGSKCTFVKLL